MGLKSFHILFIVASLGLLGFMAWWSGQRWLSGENGASLALAAASAAGLAFGVPYLGWFVKKSRSRE